MKNLSSVQNRSSKVSDSNDITKSNEVNTTHNNKGKMVSPSNISTKANNYTTILPTATTSPKRLSTLPKKKPKNFKKRRSIAKLKKTVSTPKEENTMVIGIIKCFIAFFKLMNTIFSNFLNISVGICLLLALQSAMSHAAANPSPLLNENSQLTLTSMLASKQSGSSFILYPVSALETKTYTFQIAEIG